MNESDSDSSNSDSAGEKNITAADIALMAKHLDTDSESDNDQSTSQSTPKACMYSIDTKGNEGSLQPSERKSLNEATSDESSDDDEYTVINKPQQKRYKFSTKLDHKINFDDVYTISNVGRSGNKTSSSTELTMKTQNELMKSSVMTSDIEQKHTVPPYQESVNAMRKQRQKEKANSKGKNWFDMKAPEMTEDQKNDLKVLQMRHVLDPKAFYKSNDFKNLPKFFQMGKVVENAADFYNGRVPKKQRKQTLVDELLADAKFRQFNKRKYTEAVHSKSIPRGKIKHAKRLKRKKRF